MTSWARSLAPSFVSRWLTWVLTVPTVRYNSAAISLLDRPRAISPSTSRSRPVTPSRARVSGGSPVPWGFALLAAVSSLMYGGDHAVNAWASTNLANMGDHPVEALIASVFLFGPDPWACLRGITLAGAML